MSELLEYIIEENKINSFLKELFELKRFRDINYTRDGYYDSNMIYWKTVHVLLQKINEELISILQEYKKYFDVIKETDRGDNRNSVNHGIMYPNTWTKESFEKLIHDIARISKYAKF